MKKNKLREVLKAGRLAIGTWFLVKCPEAVEAAGAAGFDFVIIDTEHGSYDLESVVEMIRAAESQGATPIVRTPDGSLKEIKRALDAGAVGILVPDVRTGEEASQIIRFTKYETEGRRGSCPVVRATMYGITDWKTYTEWCEENTMVWALIEHTDGVRNIDSIVSAGVDAIMLGPFDLCMSMGLKGDRFHPDVTKALTHVTEVACSKGVDVVAVLAGPEPEEFLEEAKFWKSKGCRLITTIIDTQYLSYNYQRVLAKFREFRE